MHPLLLRRVDWKTRCRAKFAVSVLVPMCIVDELSLCGITTIDDSQYLRRGTGIISLAIGHWPVGMSI